MDFCKKLLHHLRPAILITLAMMLICGLAYPFLLTGLSQVIFPDEANGSLIRVDGEAVGSRYVGQDFTAPWFMQGRPSAVHYNTYVLDENGNKVYQDGSPFSGLASGSNNYAPSNPALVERVERNVEEFLEKNPTIKREDIPGDLMADSGSGLDPHISPAAAAIQLPRISEASGLAMETLEAIVSQNTEHKLLGVFGEERVNVLGVNIGISEAMKGSAAK